MRTGLCNGIVLHDFDVNQVDVKGLFEFMERWFTDHGYPPNRASGTAQGLINSTKTKTFKHIKDSLEKNAFINVKDFSLMNVPNGGADGFDYIFLGDFDKDRISCMFDENQHSFNPAHIIQLISELIEYVNPRYGYAYQRDFSLAPYCYNMGMIAGLPTGEGFEYKRWQIAEWSRRYGSNNKNKYETGQFRDIYPYNIICEKHLDLVVEGKKLAAWIASDPLHGTLTQLNENLWIWHVSEENIPMVREVLRPTGQVICI